MFPLSRLLPFTHSSRFFLQFSFFYSKFVFGVEAPTFMASNTCRGISSLPLQNHIFNQSVPQKPKIKSLSPQLQPPSLSLPILFLPWFIPQTWNLYPSIFPNFRVNLSSSKALWILSIKFSPAASQLSSLLSLQFKPLSSFLDYRSSL